MPTNFTRPSAVEILTRVKSDVEGELSGVSARLRRTVELGLAKAITGVSHTLHGHLAWVAEQILPDTASTAFLLRWASLFGVDRTPAVAATGSISVTGTGGTIASGTQFLRLVDGQVFTADATTAAVTSDDIAVTALVAGSAGNLETGEALQLSSPISGIDSAATVTSPGLSGGIDQETLPALLARLLLRIQKPPMGGAPSDHVTWALEVPGVTRAWEYAGTDGLGNPALGKVAVAFVRDGDGSGAAIIPDAGEVATVQAYLDARSPAMVEVFAPTPVTLNYHIVLVPYGDANVQNAVIAELQDMLARDAEPGGTILLSRFNEAVSVAAGETSHTTITPAADVTHNFGEIAILSAIPNWT
jgi:uncharacterized phage protein gp47/JayE